MNRRATDDRTRGHRIQVKAWALAFVAVACALAGSRVARAAAGDVEAIHFHYDAPAACPAEGELVAAAVEMGGAFRIAPPGEPARALDVVIEKTDRGFSGSLAVRSLTGDERVRTVTCGRCESVVRALGLFVALALEPAVPPSARPPPETEALPVEPLLPEERERPDRSGGIAVSALWSHIGWTPNGASVMAVAAAGPTRIGVVVAAATQTVQDDVIAQGFAQSEVATGQGWNGRLGAVASWGAPWSRDAWVGLVTEVGAKASVVHGTAYPAVTTIGYASCATSYFAFGGTGGITCVTGPGAPTTWRSLTPYVAGTFVAQLAPPRLPVRPFLGLTLVWSGNYRGDSGASVSLDAGIAWRAW